MGELKNILNLTANVLAQDEKIKEIMGEHAEKGITTNPRLSFTDINSKYGLSSYISLSINKVEAYEKSDFVALKVNVVVDLNNNDDPAAMALELSERVIKVLTVKDLLFGMPEQFVLGDMSETYFDLDQMTWGYVILIGASKQPI